MSGIARDTVGNKTEHHCPLCGFVTCLCLENHFSSGGLIRIFCVVKLERAQKLRSHETAFM